jgi:hypothetical protein
MHMMSCQCFSSRNTRGVTLAGQTTPLAGEAGDVSPPSWWPRQKRCATLFKFVSFSFSSLSLSLLPQGPGKGIFRKGSFSTKETCPEPSYWSGVRRLRPTRFGNRPRALGLRALYWSGVRRLAPRKGSTAAPEHTKSGMTLGTSVTWSRLGLRSRGTLGHFRDQRERFVMESHRREAPSPRTLSNGSGPNKSPTGTFGARLWATSRPLSKGARASTRITR